MYSEMVGIRKYGVNNEDFNKRTLCAALNVRPRGKQYRTAGQFAGYCRKTGDFGQVFRTDYSVA